MTWTWLSIVLPCAASAVCAIADLICGISAATPLCATTIDLEPILIVVDVLPTRTIVPVCPFLCAYVTWDGPDDSILFAVIVAGSIGQRPCLSKVLPDFSAHSDVSVVVWLFAKTMMVAPSGGTRFILLRTNVSRTVFHSDPVCAATASRSARTSLHSGPVSLCCS